MTLGLFSIGKIDLMGAGGYIAAQFIGAFGALGVSFAAHTSAGVLNPAVALGEKAADGG